MFKMFVQIQNAQHKTYQHYSDIEFVPNMLKGFHVLTHFNTYKNQKIAPNKRTQESKSKEKSFFSSQYSCRERNKCPYYRQHSAQKESPIAIFFYPLIGVFQIFFAYQKPFAVFFNKRATAKIPEVI